MVSPAEKELLAREAPDLDVRVLSLIHEAEPTTTPFDDRSGIVFIANFTHPPNADALEHYLRDVHPLVRERLSDVTLAVIGAEPPAALRRLTPEGVTFTGHVPDIRPLFGAARLSVAPLRFGAGLKGKINTSMGFGVPVVTSSIGAEGMNLKHGDDALVADDPVGFADAVVALYTDAALWERLAAGGLRNVRSQFSFERGKQAVAEILGLEAPPSQSSRG